MTTLLLLLLCIAAAPFALVSLLLLSAVFMTGLIVAITTILAYLGVTNDFFND